MSVIRGAGIVLGVADQRRHFRCCITWGRQSVFSQDLGVFERQL